MLGPAEYEVASQFAEACQEYFFLCDGGLPQEDERLYALRANLAQLGFLAYHLPEPAINRGQPTDPDDIDHEREGELPPSTHTADDVRVRLEASYPSLDEYWECLNPWEIEKEHPDIGTSDAIDDLVDLYMELDEGSSLWRRGEFNKAVKVWREGFQNYWGEHLMSLQRALYFHHLAGG